MPDSKSPETGVQFQERETKRSGSTHVIGEALDLTAQVVELGCHIPAGIEQLTRGLAGLDDTGCDDFKVARNRLRPIGRMVGRLGDVLRRGVLLLHDGGDAGSNFPRALRDAGDGADLVNGPVGAC